MAERLESIKPADIDLARCCFNPGSATPPMTDGLTDYHDRLEAYIAAH